ncbi:hypothetical protein BDV96DRAFT_575914, partial [Lophiotrema nucula]
MPLTSANCAVQSAWKTLSTRARAADLGPAARLAKVVCAVVFGIWRTRPRGFQHRL